MSEAAVGRTVAYWIERLRLSPHPEGGFYRQTYRSAIEARNGRTASTAIYFLLTADEFSAFHRLRSDEVWHFYAGSAIAVHMIDADGTYTKLTVGSDIEAGQQFQAVIPAGAWFASEMQGGGEYALTGCTVAPGFEFSDFELADREQLAAAYPQHRALIERLTRVPAVSD